MPTGLYILWLTPYTYNGIKTKQNPQEKGTLLLGLALHAHCVQSPAQKWPFTCFLDTLKPSVGVGVKPWLQCLPFRANICHVTVNTSHH